MADVADWAAETEARLLDAALPLAPQYGWTSRLVRRAAETIGLTAEDAELLLPHGPRDLAALFSYRADEMAMAALAAVDPAELKVRERIRRGVEARVEASVAHEAAARRWMGFLCLPQHLALGARLHWEGADRIWRWAGDAATDENHYSKRLILAGLLSSTLAVRISSPPAAASRHLDRGIDAVMAYEKAKARFPRGDFAARAAQALSRMRYGARAAPVGEPATPA